MPGVAPKIAQKRDGIGDGEKRRERQNGNVDRHAHRPIGWLRLTGDLVYDAIDGEEIEQRLREAHDHYGRDQHDQEVDAEGDQAADESGIGGRRWS